MSAASGRAQPIAWGTMPSCAGRRYKGATSARGETMPTAAHRLTDDDLDHMAEEDEGSHYEIIDGRL